MWRTRVGYAGGDRENPTYHRLGNHTEVVQVEFDPEVVSYQELVDIALAGYDGSRVPRQYAHVVLTQSPEQLRTARAREQALTRKTGTAPTVRIEPLTRFWNAEDYHQKYYLRNDTVLGPQFAAMFGGDEAGLRESTAAMRVNAFISGEGDSELFGNELAGYGLSDSASEYLTSVVAERSGGLGCTVPQP